MSNHLSSTRPLLPRTGAFLLALILATSLVQAQDAIRPSLAGEQAAEARRLSIDNIPYNLQAGPIRLRLSATTGIEFNDNIDLAESGKRDDFIFRPQINLHALWPVTQLNTLRLDIGTGYAFYFDHPGNNTNGLLLTPGSQLSFDVFVGDFRINFHDRFSLEQDPVSEIGFSNVSDYGRFQNTAGVTVLWDANAVVATLGFDHYNFISTESDFSYLDRSAEIISGSLFMAVTNTTGVGVEGNLIFTNYDEMLLNDSTTTSGGLFLETQVTSNIKVRVAGGYQGIFFDNGNFVGGGGGLPFLFPDQDDINDFYANILISHRLNEAITHSLSAGHESLLGVNSNFIELNYIRHTANWNIIRNTLLSTELFFEDADESGGVINEDSNRYGGAITLGYQLTRNVTVGARYQYTEKDSNRDFRDYQQNRVSLDATYSF